MTRKRLAKNKVHFIGIGGIGMSGLARWFLAQKWSVSGSDIAGSDITESLVKLGAKVKIGQRKENIPADASLVIHTAAIKDDNPELLEAKRRNLELETYAHALGGLTRAYNTFAVAGSHGKSTTTAFLALALVEGGLDPTVVIGTKLREFEGANFREGKSVNLVIEADEWNASFLSYSPAGAIVTNIDKEHLDYYKNFSNVKKSFLQFIGNVKKNGSGVVVVNADDSVLFGMKERIEKSVLRGGARVVWYSLSMPVVGQIRKVLKVAGEHNVSNALGVYILAKELGVSHGAILKAFRSYKGAWRRMEYRGEMKVKGFKFKTRVYDDYAHHPTEIRATLNAFREEFPGKNIICVFQPHQARRLKILFKDFIEAFKLADYTIITPVYEVAGRDDVSLKDSKGLVRAIKRKYPDSNIWYLDDVQKLKDFLRKEIFEKMKSETKLSPTVLIMMGAGDIFEYTEELLS